MTDDRNKYLVVTEAGERLLATLRHTGCPCSNRTLQGNPDLQHIPDCPQHPDYPDSNDYDAVEVEPGRYLCKPHETPEQHEAKLKRIEEIKAHNRMIRTQRPDLFPGVPGELYDGDDG